MVQYRRNFVAGGTYFFTLTLADRRHTLLTDHIDLLRDAMRRVYGMHPWTTDAIAVLPEHLHWLCTLPENDVNYSHRIRMVKTLFTHALRARGVWARTISPWQPRYWEHTIRDALDFENHVAYIHFNPVNHGHAQTVAAWPHSSFRRYVRDGLLPVDWAGGGDVVVMGD